MTDIDILHTRETPERPFRLEDFNGTIDLEAQRLVSHKETDAAIAEKPRMKDYYVEAAKDDMAAVVMKAIDGVSAEQIFFRDVPANKPGDISIFINKKMGGAERAKFVSDELPKLRDALEESMGNERFNFMLVGPFINVEFDRKSLMRGVLKEVLDAGESYGESDVLAGTKSVLDYSAPNIAKRLHAGHMRSTSIGEAMKRMIDAAGGLTYGVNHIGDWGELFGLMIVGIEEWGEEVSKKIDKDTEPAAFLGEIYKRSKAQKKAEEALPEDQRAFSNRTKQAFSVLEEKSSEKYEEYLRVWTEIREMSLQEFQALYDKWGIKFDAVMGEAFYEDKMADVVQDCIDAGIVFEDADGTLVLRFQEKIDLNLMRGKKGIIRTREGLDAPVFEGNFDYLDIKTTDIDTANGNDTLSVKIVKKLSKQEKTVLGIDVLRVEFKCDKRWAIEQTLVDEAGKINDDYRFNIKDLERLGVVSEGKLVVNTLPNAVLRTKDGRSLYLTRDLAAIKYRGNRFNADKIIYVVGKEQTTHFNQVFEAARKLRLVADTDSTVHIPFGHLKQGGSKISSREGADSLQDMIANLEEEAAEAMRQRHVLHSPESSDLDPELVKMVSEQVTSAALIFLNFTRNLATDIHFDPSEILNVKEKSGPFLQYQCVRIKSLLDGLKEVHNIGDIKIPDDLNPDALSLVKKIADFPATVAEAAQKATPNIVAKYLLDLASIASSLYSGGPKLKSLEESDRAVYVAVYQATLTVLTKGLNMFNISVPVKM